MPTTTEIIETLAAKTERRVATLYSVIPNESRTLLAQVRLIRAEMRTGDYDRALILTRVAIQMIECAADDIPESVANRYYSGLRRIETNLVSLSRLDPTVRV